MKLYTFYTDSHLKLLMSYLLPSIEYNGSQFDVAVYKVPQYCQSGDYMQNGWIQTMIRKVEYHIKSCQENMDKIFIYSDCDVQFLGKENIIDVITKEIDEYDIACQDDVYPFHNHNTYCAGFFACKGNQRTLDFFHKILHDIHRNKSWLHDQEALNINLPMVKHKLLSHKFFTHAQITHKLWNNENDTFNISRDILVHHANWTHGVENKMKLLNIVKEQYENINNGT